MKNYHATFDCRPFRKAGLTPSQVRDIYNSVNSWITSCGPEWTVDHLKAIKQLYVLRLTGRNYTPIPWLAVDGEGSPKGAFRPLFKSIGKGHNKVRRCLDALMVYTGIVLKRVSKRQREKFFTSMTAPPVKVIMPRYWDRAIAEINHFAKSVTFQRLTYRQFNLSGTKSSLDAVGRSAPNTCERFVDDFRTSIIWDLLDDDDICDVIADSLDDLWRPLFREIDEDIQSDIIGRISCIQEKGCKGRFIAVPRLTAQLGLQSLGKALLRCCEQVPWDCTHNQTAGLEWCKSQLQSGTRLYSVDVSDFTNHWPLELIEKCLRELHLSYEPGDLKLFNACATNSYLFGDKRLCWSKGQPLGTFPSFPAAALSHGAVLRALEVDVGVRDSFRVLGDDVVISDPYLYEKYRDFLSQHDIPISPSKTLEAADIGEFAGGVITCRGYFIPRKVIIPKASNTLIAGARSEKSVHCAKTPKEFLSALIAIAEGSNPDGLTLDERAQLLSLILARPDEARTCVYEKKHLVGRIREYYSRIKPERSTITVSRDWLNYWVDRTMTRCLQQTETLWRQVHAKYLRSKALVSANFTDTHYDRLDREVEGTFGPLSIMYYTWYKPHETADPFRYFGKMACYCVRAAEMAATETPWKQELPVEQSFVRKVVSKVTKREMRDFVRGPDMARQELLEIRTAVIELLT